MYVTHSWLFPNPWANKAVLISKHYQNITSTLAFTIVSFSAFHVCDWKLLDLMDFSFLHGKMCALEKSGAPLRFPISIGCAICPGLVFSMIKVASMIAVALFKSCFSCTIMKFIVTVYGDICTICYVGC